MLVKLEGAIFNLVSAPLVPFETCFRAPSARRCPDVILQGGGFDDVSPGSLERKMRYPAVSSLTRLFLWSPDGTMESYFMVCVRVKLPCVRLLKGRWEGEGLIGKTL